MKTQAPILACILFLLTVLCASPMLWAGAETPAGEASTSASSMAVIEASSGRLLYAKNPEQRREMASTTKICTAITVLEHCNDLEKTIEVPKEAVGVEGSSIYLQCGEKVKVIDLLYGLMLRSGNDCAVALAITTAGSIADFAALMNQTAVKAGATNSNFVNPHGLHHAEHYTTALDLARITAYAFKNETFAKIVATKTHTMPWEGRNYPRVMHNKNKILHNFAGGDGVKTGFTKAAGRCLVSSATRNGMRVIAVVLNCGPMFEECSALMEKAFSEFSMFDPLPEPIRATASVSDGKATEVALAGRESLRYPIKKGEEGDFAVRTKNIGVLSAPVQEGQKCGEYEITFQNRLLFCGNLYTIDSVPALDYKDKLGDVIGAW